MQPRKRLIRFCCAVALSSMLATCGGGQEPTADQPTQPDAASAEPEAPPTVAVEPEPEPQAPAEPQLEGTINLTGDEMGWLSAGNRDTPARYWWSLTVQNDTTQTLDITVRWDFLDAEDRVIKTDFTTVQMAPAATEEVRREGEMSYEDSMYRLAGYRFTYDWAIAS